MLRTWYTLRTMNTQHSDRRHSLVSALRLAAKFNVSRSTIYRMADAGIIPSIRVGSKLGGRRFDEDAVREALEKHSVVEGAGAESQLGGIPPGVKNA